MIWTKTLVLSPQESLEERVQRIIEFIINNYDIVACQITNIDATGTIGNELTQKINNGEIVILPPKEVLALLQSDGQIFELYLDIKSTNNFHIRVSDGIYVDLFGDAALPDSIVGNSVQGDLDNY